jgi:hypothetical protein
MLLQIKIPGRLIGKKNAKKVVRRGSRCMLVAKKEWDEYHAHAMDYFRLFHFEMQRMGNAHRFPIPRHMPVHVSFHYHPPSHVRPDLSAVMETVGDLLEAPRMKTDAKTGLQVCTREGGNIIEDDKQILSWDGSRLMEIRKTEPFIVIWIQPYNPIAGEYELKEPPKRRKK